MYSFTEGHFFPIITPHPSLASEYQRAHMSAAKAPHAAIHHKVSNVHSHAANAVPPAAKATQPTNPPVANAPAPTAVAIVAFL